MSHRIRFLACGLLIAGAILPAAAQITIDTNDVKQMYAVGTYVTYQLDSTTTTADIGTTGASSWDFSGLKTTSTMPLVSVPVSATPYAGQFPNATHVLKDTALYLNVNLSIFGTPTNVILIGTGYDYLTLDGDLFDSGLIGDGKAYLGTVTGNGNPAHGEWLNSPSAVYYGLPLEVGNSWSTGFRQSLSGHADLGGLGSLNFGPIVTVHSITYSVDAYGPMKLPGGYTEDALRIRKEDRSYDTTGAKYTFVVGYIFLTKRGAEVQFNQTDTTSSSGMVGVRSVQWNDPLVPTAVAQTPGTPRVFALYPNYPNPFNPTTTIAFSVSQRGNVSLKVFNLLGQEVATLVNGALEPGQKSVQFNAGNLPSGVYFYRLQSNGGSLTRKMVLTK
ncbi:MAG: T9SS type A sorting domain-containing protein [Bacteroidota bacterium]